MSRPKTRKNSEKVQWLMRYRTLVDKASFYLSEVQALEDRLYSVGSPKYDGQPKGNGAVDRTELLDRHVDLIEECNRYADLAHQAMHEIEEAISGLEDPVEERVLRHRYMSGETWYTIAAIFGYEQRQIFRIHGQALEHIVIKDLEHVS